MKRLLVIRLGALGDLFHLSPALAALGREQPDCSVHVLTSPMYRTLLESLDGVDQVWCWDKKAGWRSWWALLCQLRAVGFDAVVNLHPSLKTLGLMYGVGAARYAVYHKQKRAVKGQAQRSQPRWHATRDFYEPFCRLGVLMPPAVPVPVPHWNLLPSAWPESTPRRENSQVWLAVLPGVGLKRGNRAWSQAQYAQLLEALLTHTPNLRVMLVGGPDERDVATALQAMSPHRIENHCGQHDWFGTAALLRQCVGVVGGDTGPLHMAAALGVPTLGLFGPTNPQRTGPVGEAARVLTPPEALACWPCEQSRCPLSGEASLACMQQITVEEVLACCADWLAPAARA